LSVVLLAARHAVICVVAIVINNHCKQGPRCLAW